MDQMDQKLLRQREAQCVQENPPGCMARCPVHVDVRGLVEAVGKGEYAKGFALLQRVIPFPGIISRICDQPCQQDCKRREIDEPIFIKGLEEICVRYSQTKADITRLPAKNKKAAVVGAGLSGLTVAFELGRKGYNVEVFEAEARLGGMLCSYSDNQLPLQAIKEDFSVFAKLPVKFHYNTTVTSLKNLIETFDAVYLGTGSLPEWVNDVDISRNEEGVLEEDPVTLAVYQDKVFAGGRFRRLNKDYSPIFSVSDGKIAAASIDRLFQDASLTANRKQEGPFSTALYTSTWGITSEKMVHPADPIQGYAKEEAGREAGRCLLCECLECVKVCEYLAHYRSYPKRYVREIYNNLSIVMGIHRANKMINSCSLCGLCAKVCPGNLDMGEICLEARRTMVEKGKMPPSTHDFALRDMRFSNSGRCSLDRHQPGYSVSKYVFFPGCQLAASSPQYVKQAYAFLCEKLDGGVGLMLGCCGAPANWAGQEDIFADTLQEIERKRKNLGSPCIITACPSCHSLFKQNLPDVPIESFWTVADKMGLPDELPKINASKILAVHDSCTAREERDIQDSVRSIVKKVGFQVEELPFNRENTTCCSYGGLMLHANKEIARKVIQRRIEESESDYLAYCVMCRDNFVNQGKRVYHLFDLIFAAANDNIAEQRGPGYSQRQENRERLKNSLLRDFWGENMEEKQTGIQVNIPEDVRNIMEERMILTEDVMNVIAYAETSGNRLKNGETGCYIAYLQLLNVTYWVEYFPENNAFTVRNAYCHRINITE